MLNIDTYWKWELVCPNYFLVISLDVADVMGDTLPTCREILSTRWN